jgi:hypothetical protein
MPGDGSTKKSQKPERTAQGPSPKEGRHHALPETLEPPRNFFISTADRIRAASGPPAYSRRKRHIEDLEASLLKVALAALAECGIHAEIAAVRRFLEEHPRVQRELREANRLIAAHNLYYPIEANLRLDPTTREQMDHGRPWRPLDALTLEVILERAHARARS